MPNPLPTLPTGLRYHCSACRLVIPTDAPDTPHADCMCIVEAKLSTYYPGEPLSTQHRMASATWSLIHRQATLADTPHPEAMAYTMHRHNDPVGHYNASAVRAGMTEAQVASEAGHKRDGWLYVPTTPPEPVLEASTDTGGAK